MSKKKKSTKDTGNQSSVKLYAGAGALVILIGIGILFYFNYTSADSLDTIDTTKSAHIDADIHIKGNPNALNRLVKYSDFGCVFCANQHTLLKQFFDEYGDDFSLEIKHFPINNNIPSRMAISAAISAGRQGMYWDMVDLLYANANEWRSEPYGALTRYVEILGLDLEQFTMDMNDEEVMYEVVKNYFAYQELGISATPTLFLNGERVQNPRTYEQLIEQLIK